MYVRINRWLRSHIAAWCQDYSRDIERHIKDAGSLQFRRLITPVTQNFTASFLSMTIQLMKNPVISDDTKSWIQHISETAQPYFHSIWRMLLICYTQNKTQTFSGTGYRQTNRNHEYCQCTRFPPTPMSGWWTLFIRYSAILNSVRLLHQLPYQHAHWNFRTVCLFSSRRNLTTEYEVLSSWFQIWTSNILTSLNSTK